MQLRSCAARLLPLAFVLMGSAALAATPAVTVSPTGNHPQGSTKVSGTGFGGSEQVDLYFDTTDEALVTADASGSFGPRTIPVPASALPGEHWVTAIGRTTITGGQHKFVVSTPWALFGFNDQGQRDNLYENIITPTNIPALDQAWSMGSEIVASPAIAQVTGTYNPYIFFGTNDYSVYAYDSTGALVWKQTLGDSVGGSPAVSGRTVYVGSIDKNVYAFDARTGAPAWPAPAATDGGIYSSPTVADGIVYVASSAKLFAFHASDGTPAWPSPAVAGGGLTAPTVAHGIVYAGGQDDGKMYAFEANTGKPAWVMPFQSAEGIHGSPAVAGGKVFFGVSLSSENNFYALNAKSGVEEWAVPVGGWIGQGVDTSPAVVNGVVYAGTYAAGLWALRARDGSTLWNSKLTGHTTSNPSVAHGIVYIGVQPDDEQRADVEAFDAKDGSTLWTATTGGFAAQASPVISDGMLYVGSNEGKLYAYALDAGDNAAYQFRKVSSAPPHASLHPDMRLQPQH